ncbi:MAG: hypothetical protein MJZ15_05210 [Bacteroidales bacterium]|nr:hypothetical protein [Bacteroidales bacterium]
MNTDNINTIDDIKAARNQINKKIELTHQQLDLNVTRLKYQIMPSSMLQSLFSRVSERIMTWIDARLS